MKSKIVTALISLAIAILVWLYVVTVISPNSSKYFYNFEVGIQGSKLLEEQDLVIMSADISTVTLHLEGNRIDLNKLSSANIIVDVDVSKICPNFCYIGKSGGARRFGNPSERAKDHEYDA